MTQDKQIPGVCIAGNPTIEGKPCGDPFCVCSPDNQWVAVPEDGAWYRRVDGVMMMAPMFIDGSRDDDAETEVEETHLDSTSKP